MGGHEWESKCMPCWALGGHPAGAAAQRARLHQPPASSLNNQPCRPPHVGSK